MEKLSTTKILIPELEAAYKRKDGYIMGSKGQNPRTGQMNLSSTVVKSAWKPDGWYYTQYSGKQRDKALYWRANATRVWDCNGMSEGVYELHTGVNIDSKARYNYAQWCDPKGSGMIPTQYRVPGAAVFWSDDNNSSTIHHVAYLYKPVVSGKPEGDWYLIEARGVMYGVVMTKLLSRKPNFWGLMTKYYEYSDTEVPMPTTQPHLGDRILRNGCEGDDVKELQTNLIRLGYDCGKWGADGDFGDATEMAVRAFQRNNDLVVDGQFGPKSAEVMDKLLAALDGPIENPNPKKVLISGGNCYVRSEPSTSGEIMGVAYSGTTLSFANEISPNEWLKVVYKENFGWVSGKYGRLTDT